MSKRHLSGRRVLLPKDTNPGGEIFGGILLSEIDLAGAVETRYHTAHDVVTISFKEVVFKKPVQVGDLVSFYTILIKKGTTSLHIRVDVTTIPRGYAAGEEISVTAAEIVYVAIKRAPDGTTTKTPLEG